MIVAVIAGASSGMGRACVDHLRSMVDVVVAIDIDPPSIDGAVGLARDVTEPNQVQAIVDHVRNTGTFRAPIHESARLSEATSLSSKF